MRPVCITAVSKAIGRDLTLAEARGIEQRVRSNMMMAARRDLAGFQAMSVGSRLELAAKMSADQIKADAAKDKQRTVLDVAAHDGIGKRYFTLTGSGMDPQEAVKRELHEFRDGKSIGMSLQSRITATREDYWSRLTDAINVIEPRLGGWLVNKEAQHGLALELNGEDSGNPMLKQLAIKFHEIADSVIAHYNDRGGVLHPLEDWRSPQYQDQVKVKLAGEDAWVNDHVGWIKPEWYVKENGRLMTEDERRAFLVNAWDTLQSGGANKIDPEKPGEFRTMIANRHAEHRQIVYKDGESFWQAQLKYGNQDLYTAMRNHLAGMARDVALIEHFGSNAERDFAYWNDTAARDSRHKVKDSQVIAQKLEDGFRYLSGASRGVADPMWARVFDDARNVLTAADLGSAIINSIPDPALMFATAVWNNLNPMRSYWNWIRLLNPAATADRRMLEREGMMINTALNGLARFQVDNLGSSWSAKLANSNMVMSFMNHWTDTGRAAHVLNHAHGIASIIKEHAALADVPEVDRSLLLAKGITDVDYQVWRLAGIEKTKWGDLLMPNGIYRIPDAEMAGVKLSVPDVTTSAATLRSEAARKLLGMLISESNMAIYEPGSKERLFMGAGKPAGSMGGELARSFWQWKTWPYGMFQEHFVERGWHGHDTIASKLAWESSLFVGLTTLGALAVEIGDILIGKDPRPLWNVPMDVLVRNWTSALLKGGALSVYADMIGATTELDWKKLLGGFVGPVGGTVIDAMATVGANAVKAAVGKETHFGRDAVHLAKGVTPYKSLWYTKAATDHWIFNQLMEETNPGYLARTQSRVGRKTGATYFWPPNKLAPERPPDLTRIGGN
jgi:hypothetical protein